MSVCVKLSIMVARSGLHSREIKAIVSAAKFLLEHFYYGQRVQEGKATGMPQLLAKSPGVTDAMVQHAISRANLPPLIQSAKGAWALVRGKSRQMPFLLVQSQQGAAEQRMEHYIIAQPDALKAMGGNLKALMVTVEDVMPSFETTKVETLDLYALEKAEPPTIEEQIDDILELMMTTNNRTQLIEPLLAAIVQGTQLIVQGAPSDIAERVQFVEGLLALLPASARFGVTFTTHSLPSSEIDTQIRFYSDDMPPPETTVFNWATKKISGEELEDDYSRFIISLLRLDAELVIQRNLIMTQTAGWRLNEGDNLAKALGYAAHRLRVDEALRNNQPADKDEVAKILGDDPTLTDELRVLYARHLVKFSLAMQDMQHAEPVAILLHSHPELSQSILNQMRDALNDGEAWLIYDTLVNWMSNPLGPQGEAWINLTHSAALQYIEDVASDRDFGELNTLMNELQFVDPGVSIEKVMPQILQKTLPLAPEDAELAQNLFLLAVKYLDSSAFESLMNAGRFRQMLDLQITKAWSHIHSDQTGAPEGLLLQISRSFGEAWEPIILTRFAHIAAVRNHYDLLDTPTLAELLQIALDPPTDADYRSRIRQIVACFSDEGLKELEQPGPRLLFQIYLANGDYIELAHQMIRHARIVYPGDLQLQYVEAIEHTFSKTPIPVEQLPIALEAIRKEGIKSVPYLMACIGAMNNSKGTPELDEIGVQVAQHFQQEPRLLGVIPARAVLQVLKYFVDRNHIEGATEAARAVPLSAAYQEDGINMLSAMYKLMQNNDTLEPIALDGLRAYVREVEEERVESAIRAFEAEVGLRIGEVLRTTHVVSSVIGHVTLIDYAQFLEMTCDLLTEMISHYLDPRQVMDVKTLSSALQNVPGRLAQDERDEMRRAILSVGRHIIQLSQNYKATRPRDEERYVQAVLSGKADAHTSLDVMRGISGFMARGRRAKTEFSTNDGALFREYSTMSLFQTMTVASALLDSAATGFSGERIAGQVLHQEAASLLRTVTEEERQEHLRSLALNLQRLPDIIVKIETDGDAKAFEDGNLQKRIDTGKHAPRNVLEFLRFMYAFYR